MSHFRNSDFAPTYFPFPLPVSSRLVPLGLGTQCVALKTWSEVEILAKTLAHPLGINSVNTLHDGCYRQGGICFIIMVLNL